MLRCVRNFWRSSYLNHSGFSSRCFNASSQVRQLSLPRPTALLETNHLLVVNKPPGWLSAPNQKHHTSQSNDLLKYLQTNRLGGGSENTFLKPLHRIDQPCSGVLLFGKTSKAASRIQSKWSGMKKTYLVVLDGDTCNLEQLRRQSSVVDGTTGWAELSGLMLKKRRPRDTSSPSSKGWSVTILPLQPEDMDGTRLCTLEWKLLSDTPPYLLGIHTHHGARHMIRALLSTIGKCPVAGDLRYGTKLPLSDRSVALHARRLIIPDDIRLSLDQRDFVAPIPATWLQYFDLSEEDVEMAMRQRGGG